MNFPSFHSGRTRYDRWLKLERGRKAFVSYTNYLKLEVPLRSESRVDLLFNCTNEDYLYTILLNVTGEFLATVHNYDLSPLVRKETQRHKWHSLG